MNNEAMGQMVPFVRNSEYLRKLALKQRGLNKLVRAIELLRLSLEKAPDDVRTKMELAQTYASARCPALSNQVLFTILNHASTAADCFYLVAQNFISMRMDQLAGDCLAIYLQQKPYGVHAGEALELLEMMGQSEEEAVSMEDRVNGRILRVLSSLDDGKPALAVRQIKRVLGLDRRNSGVHALLSFALLSAGNAGAALSAARKALRYSDQDLRALCAVAVSLNALDMKEAGKRFLARASKSIEDEEDAQVVCQTACEMKEHEYVRSMLKEMEQHSPYAVDLLHMLAVASFNTQDVEEATRCWQLILRLDPTDSVARYRLNQAAKGPGDRDMPYIRQVPLLETLSRLSIFRGWVQEGKEKLLERWAEDGELAQMVRWGLESGEAGVPEAMVNILAMLADEKAQAMLKELLCDVQLANAVKHSALAALCMMDQKGPFYAMINHRLTLVHVSKMDEYNEDTHTTTLYESVKKRFGQMTEQDSRQMRALCRIAIHSKTKMGEMFRLNGVELAMRQLCGEYRLSDKKLYRRKLMRYACRIMREYQKDAVHSV